MQVSEASGLYSWAFIVVAFIVVAYIVMAYVVNGLYSSGLCSYGLSERGIGTRNRAGHRVTESAIYSYGQHGYVGLGSFISII